MCDFFDAQVPLYRLATTIEDVHIFTNLHCKCKLLSAFLIYFMPSQRFLTSTSRSAHLISRKYFPWLFEFFIQNISLLRNSERLCLRKSVLVQKW